MSIILNCTNLLGDSLYLLRPVEEYIKDHDVCAIVTDRGLAYELFYNVFEQTAVHVFPALMTARMLDPEAIVIDLNAGRSGELCFKTAQATGKQPHISEGYASILGISLGSNIKPPTTWQRVNDKLPRTFFAISPFSRSCARHSGERPNKTLDDFKWEYIIRFLRRQGMPVKVVAGPNDRLTKCSVPLDDYFTAKNLLDLETFLKSCALLISVDNGLGHIASILDTPMISLWPQVSNLQFIGPGFSPKTGIVQIGDPNIASPSQMLMGIRHFAKELLGGLHEEEVSTIQLEEES